MVRDRLICKTNSKVYGLSQVYGNGFGKGLWLGLGVRVRVRV